METVALEGTNLYKGPEAANIYSGRVRATARYEVTWKDKMKRMERTDVVGSYLQL